MCANLLSRIEKLERDGLWPLSGEVDLERIAVVGHSLGGLVALRTCATDPRVRACANLDGVANHRERDNGLRKPVLLVRAGDGHADWFQEMLLSPLAHESSRGYDLLIDSATQESFSDLPRWRSGESADAAAEAIHRTVMEHLLWFLDRELRGALAAPPEAGPGVTFTRYG